MLYQLVYEDVVGNGVRSIAKTERNNTHRFSFIQPSQLSCCRRLTGWWNTIFLSYVHADYSQSHSCSQCVWKSLPGMFTPSLSQGLRRGWPTCSFPDPLKGRSDIATFHFSGTSPNCHNLTETTESSLTLANSFNTRFKHCLCYFPMSRILYGLLSYFCGLWCSKSNHGISPFLHKTMNKWVLWNGISPSVIPPCKISLWIQWMKTSWVSMTISHGAQAFKKT